MTRLIQSFSVPRGKRDILNAIEARRTLTAIGRIPNGGVLSREGACHLIGVDPAPMSSPDPILRDAFTKWFHSYLRILRRAVIDAGLPVLLEYPEKDENGDSVGRGIAMLKLEGSSAAAFLLVQTCRETSLLQKRSAKRMLFLLSDEVPMLNGETARTKRALKQLVNNMLAQSKVSAETTKLLTAESLRLLPSLEEHFENFYRDMEPV